MEGTKKRTLVEGCGDLSDLSTQFSGHAMEMGSEICEGSFRDWII